MNTYAYSTVWFVPNPALDERVAVGLIVVDQHEGQAQFRRVRALRRIVRALAPDVFPDLIEQALNSLREKASGQPLLWNPERGDTAVRRLQALADGLVNQIQLANPRVYRAATLTDATTRLASSLLDRPTSTDPPSRRTRDAVRREIRATLANWDLRGHRIESEQLKPGPSSVSHHADVWLVNGHPRAALYALVGSDERWNVLLRDSLPIVLQDFRNAQPNFNVVAVTDASGHPPEWSSIEFLRAHDVLISNTEELDSLEGVLLE